MIRSPFIIIYHFLQYMLLKLPEHRKFMGDIFFCCISVRTSGLNEPYTNVDRVNLWIATCIIKLSKFDLQKWASNIASLKNLSSWILRIIQITVLWTEITFITLLEMIDKAKQRYKEVFTQTLVPLTAHVSSLPSRS